MSAVLADFGISRSAALALRRLFERTPGIERVWVFGSRARGKARENSDIDLAIEGQGSPDKREFMDLARRDGLRAALNWRDARFAPKSGA